MDQMLERLNNLDLHKQEAINMGTLYEGILSMCEAVNTTAAHSSGSSAKMAQTARKQAETMYQQYMESVSRYYGELLTIENWLQQCDPELAAVIRYHYIIGYDWRQTSKAVYGKPSYHRARKKIFRYFGEEE